MKHYHMKAAALVLITFPALFVAPLLADQPDFNGIIAFYSEGYSDAEICLINPDGQYFTKVTKNSYHDFCPDWSPDGGMIALEKEQNGNLDIYVMNADGSGPVQMTFDPADDYHPDWSPDGSKIAFTSERDGDQEIFVLDIESGQVTQLTYNDAGDMRPCWSADGAQLLFNSHRDGNWEIYKMDEYGNNQVRLTNTAMNEMFPQWSPDNTKIAFSDWNPPKYGDIYVMDEYGNVLQLTTDPAVDEDAAWSPDGSQIVFQSTRDGNFEIYVMNADGSNQTNITNRPNTGEYWPCWSPKVEPLISDAAAIPASTGSAVDFLLTAGLGQSGRDYLVLGSMSGTSPGCVLPGGLSILPLNWDVFTAIICAFVNSSVFTDFYRTVDISGHGRAQLNAGPLSGGFIGLKMYYAYCLSSPFDFVSNPLEITVVP